MLEMSKFHHPGLRQVCEERPRCESSCAMWWKSSAQAVATDVVQWRGRDGRSPPEAVLWTPLDLARERHGVVCDSLPRRRTVSCHKKCAWCRGHHQNWDGGAKSRYILLCLAHSLLFVKIVVHGSCEGSEKKSNQIVLLIAQVVVEFRHYVVVLIVVIFVLLPKV